MKISVKFDTVIPFEPWHEISNNLVCRTSKGSDQPAHTVKPAVAATSIKLDSPLSGHFRAPPTILNANAPLLSVHLSNAASGRGNIAQNTEIVTFNGQ